MTNWDERTPQALRRFKAEFFRTLAHASRIKILEALREEERTLVELQALLDDEPASASRHLAVLRDEGVVVGRREGSTLYYTVWDPEIFQLLDVTREIFNNQLLRGQVTLSSLLQQDHTAQMVKGGDFRRERLKQ